MNSVSYMIPVRTESITNVHRGWKAKWAKSRKQRKCSAEMTVLMRAKDVGFPMTVTMTRVRPARGRLLDLGNLPSALKHVQDGIADGLGLKDDADPRVAWEYAERKAARGDVEQWGVEVEVSREHSAAQHLGKRGGHMSDGSMEIERDRLRADKTRRWEDAVFKWLAKPTKKHLMIMEVAADAADDVRGGYFGVGHPVHLVGITVVLLRMENCGNVDGLYWFSNWMAATKTRQRVAARRAWEAVEKRHLHKRRK